MKNHDGAALLSTLQGRLSLRQSYSYVQYSIWQCLCLAFWEKVTLSTLLLCWPGWEDIGFSNGQGTHRVRGRDCPGTRMICKAGEGIPIVYLLVGPQAHTVHTAASVPVLLDCRSLLPLPTREIEPYLHPRILLYIGDESLGRAGSEDKEVAKISLSHQLPTCQNKAHLAQRISTELSYNRISQFHTSTLVLVQLSLCSMYLRG